MAPVAVDPIVAPAGGKKLPVTLLSGFLGAGKTTLLEHILTADHGCGRIAVIVNDMASLNVDAALLAHHKVTQTEQRVVEMQNGCICCTLRGDLLEEVADLAAGGKVDYLVIESTGISEPMQVAETFSEEFADMHAQAAEDLREEAKTDAESARLNKRVAEILAAGGLTAVSRLDTCVTMVDALNVFANFDTAEFLKDRSGEPVPEEDDRAISDLMVDQLEFANVVVINKTDLVKPSDVDRIKGLVRTLNPDARILTSSRAKVDLKEVLNTGLFNYTKAAMSAGWLKSLNEELKPETEEYGVGSFVFRARRPFHPERLWKTVKEVYVIAQAEFIDDGMDGDEEEEDDGDGDSASSSSDDDMADADAELNPGARLEAKKADATWSGVLRSKGFFWLASRPLLYGEWSSAGVMLSLMGGPRWRCEVPEDEWGTNPDVIAAIRRDFEGEWGDRRQEIVFIGTGMRDGGEARLRSAMDACLLTDAEMSEWMGVMRSKTKKLKTLEQKEAALQELFPDGFEDWQDPEAEELDDDGVDHRGHKH